MRGGSGRKGHGVCQTSSSCLCYTDVTEAVFVMLSGANSSIICEIIDASISNSGCITGGGIAILYSVVAFECFCCKDVLYKE